MTSLGDHRSPKEEMKKSVLYKHPGLLNHWPCLCWLRQGCRPGQAGLCSVFKVQQESAMPLAVLKRPCTRWLSLQALCPLPCWLYQPPSCQRQAGLPGSASSTLRSVCKFSSSVRPDQQLSMSAFTGVLGTLLGFG